MKRLLVLAMFIAATAAAHPGVGIVVDSHGNVFYTDLKHVWRIAPDGTKTIAVANVHTHELYLDGNDNLYGEHLWYNGEKADTWGSRVWRRSPDGKIVDVVPAHPGFNTFSFVRDARGNAYRAVRESNEIRMRSPDGRETTIARGHFNDIRWMTVTADGTVYFIDLVDLVRVSNGVVTTVARNLSVPKRHAVMGLWTDRVGNVYVADYHGDKVKRVDPRGSVTVVEKTSFPWAPTGGTFDFAGNLWLLECNVLNAVRVRKITARGRTSGPACSDRSPIRTR